MSNGEKWKELTRRMIDAGGTRKQVAYALGVSETDLSNWIKPEHPRFIPVDHLVDLDAMVGDIFLHELARLRGFELTLIEHGTVSTEKAISAVADLVRDSGSLGHDVIEASQDGVICPREEREIRGEIGQVYNCLHSLEGALAS